MRDADRFPRGVGVVGRADRRQCGQSFTPHRLFRSSFPIQSLIQMHTLILLFLGIRFLGIRPYTYSIASPISTRVESAV